MFSLRFRLFLSLLLIAGASVFAQNGDMCNSVPPTLKKGIYMSFQEYKNNEPSFTSEFKVFNNEKIKYEDSLGNWTEVTNAWGYSNGKNAYIYFRSAGYFDGPRDFNGGTSGYYLIGIKGVISHFAVDITETYSSPMYAGNGLYTGVPMPVSSTRLKQFLVAPNGEIVQFSKKNVKRLISSDLELLEKYKGYRGTDKSYRFIKLYNCRNAAAVSNL